MDNTKQKCKYEELKQLFEQFTLDKESDELEFKSAAGGFPHSFWETYSSFANTNGGAIIFGIKEKGDFLIFDGLTSEQIAKYKRDFFNNIHNKQKISISLITEKDVYDFEYNKSHFLIFYIPRADRSLKPVYVGLEPYSGTYRRDIDGDYHCSKEEVNSMFADANLASPADGRILKNYTIDDLDLNSIKQYRRRFEQWNPDHIWNALPDNLFLKKINVFRTDRKTGEYGLSYAGLLMFGTYSAIIDENPNFFPDYQEIQDPSDRWINRICPDGNWESNLFQFYSRVLPILQNFLPKPFILEENQRKTETSAHIAIREALTNALVHADYTENASLNIYKYPNKIIFSNPGTLLISLKQYYRGGESVCRNKYLQTMFTFLGSAEKAGSGADKIIHGWEEQKWKRPYITENNRPNKVVLTMSMESLLDKRTIDALENLFDEKRIRNLTQPQLTALAIAYTEEEITNERLQYALDMHRADITKMLSGLCSNNLLKSSGHGRGTKYQVLGLNVTLHSHRNATNVTLNKTNVTLKEQKNDCNVTLSPKYVTPVRRYTKQQLKDKINETCQDWVTAEQIAENIERNVKYVKSHVIPQFSNLLMKMYDIPHHPRQKYKLKSK